MYTYIFQSVDDGKIYVPADVVGTLGDLEKGVRDDANVPLFGEAGNNRLEFMGIANTADIVSKPCGMELLMEVNGEMPELVWRAFNHTFDYFTIVYTDTDGGFAFPSQREFLFPSLDVAKTFAQENLAPIIVLGILEGLKPYGIGRLKFTTPFEPVFCGIPLGDESYMTAIYVDDAEFIKACDASERSYLFNPDTDIVEVF